MHWLNVAVTLLLGLALVGLLALAAADLLGLLRGPRWRTPGRARAPGEAVGATSLLARPGAEDVGATPEAEPLARILYAKDGRIAHAQPLPPAGSAFIGRQAFAGLSREVAFRALEVAWRDGMPAVRSLDPGCAIEVRVPGEEAPVLLEAGGDWEPWPEEAEIALGGHVLRWREPDEEVPR